MPTTILLAPVPGFSELPTALIVHGCIYPITYRERMPLAGSF